MGGLICGIKGIKLIYLYAVVFDIESVAFHVHNSVKCGQSWCLQVISEAAFENADSSSYHPATYGNDKY